MPTSLYFTWNGNLAGWFAKYIETVNYLNLKHKHFVEYQACIFYIRRSLVKTSNCWGIANVTMLLFPVQWNLLIIATKSPK
jgi:hypothetical protein